MNLRNQSWESPQHCCSPEGPVRCGEVEVSGPRCRSGEVEVCGLYQQAVEVEQGTGCIAPLLSGTRPPPPRNAAVDRLPPTVRTAVF